MGKKKSRVKKKKRRMKEARIRNEKRRTSLFEQIYRSFLEEIWE